MTTKFLVVLLILIGLTGCGEKDVVKDPIFLSDTSSYSPCYNNYPSSMATADNPMCVIYYLNSTQSYSITIVSPKNGGAAAPPLIAGIGATVVCALTLVDVIGLAVSVNDFLDDPTLVGAGLVGVDILAIASPVPGPTATKQVLRATNGADLARFLKSFTRDNTIHNLKVISGVSDATRKRLKLEAHHIFPQKFRDRFEKLDIVIDDPQFLTWWQQGSHQKYAREYNDKIEKILDEVEKLNITKEQKRKRLLLEISEVVDEYSEFYYQNRYYFKVKD